MIKIDQVRVLNSKAHNMIAGYVTDSPLKRQYLHEFLEMANKHNIQGPAITSYYTVLHGIEEDRKLIDSKSVGRFLNLKNYVRDLIAPKEKSASAKVPKQRDAVDDELDVFVNKLNEMYHNSLRTRISVANQGAVKSDTIVEKSWGKNMMIKINLLLDKMMDLCKPVE